MRRFELTIGVFVGDGVPLPQSFREWVELAGLCDMGASPTTLERVVETRHPLSKDVIEKRKGLMRPWA